MVNYTDSILEFIVEKGGATMASIVAFCSIHLGANAGAYNAISELIVNGMIEGDLWDGVILWKEKDW